MEEESRVLRLERRDWSDLMFPSQEERERFCLGLDYCRKTSSKSSLSDLFLRYIRKQVEQFTHNHQR